MHFALLSLLLARGLQYRRTQRAAGLTVIPATVFHGAQPGPVLAISAGVHGAEYAPILAIQRFLPRVAAKQLRGTR